MRNRSAIMCVGLLVTACAEDRLIYAGTEFEVQSAPPSTASFEPDQIVVAAGEAVKVLAMPRSSGELQYQAPDLLRLRPQNADVIDVYSTEHEREFVFVGNEPGQTCVEVTINREREECIDVRVMPPVTE